MYWLTRRERLAAVYSVHFFQDASKVKQTLLDIAERCVAG